MIFESATMEKVDVFHCKFCPKTFDQERYRDRHQDDSHLRKLKKCPFCNKEMTGTSLSRHLRNKICQKPAYSVIQTKRTMYTEGDIAELKEYKLTTTVQVVVLRDQTRGLITNDITIDGLNVRLACAGNFQINNHKTLIFFN